MVFDAPCQVSRVLNDKTIGFVNLTAFSSMALRNKGIVYMCVFGTILVPGQGIGFQRLLVLKALLGLK